MEQIVVPLFIIIVVLSMILYKIYEKSHTFYEYIVRDLHTQSLREKEIADTLSTMNQDGWELVTAMEIGSYGSIRHRYYFKREKKSC